MRSDPDDALGSSGPIQSPAGLGDDGAVRLHPWDERHVRASAGYGVGLAGQAGRLWRIFGTGLSFAVFGGTALGLTLLVFPLCHLVGGGARRRQARVQRVIHCAYRSFVGLMERLGLFRTDWCSLERLPALGPQLIVANHPTLIDIVHLIAKLPQADCVIADGYARNPFLGFAARQAGYLTNARGAAVVDACVERLRAGRTVVLFPEGTRSPRNRMHPFKRGAAHIALRAGVPLTPIAISCVPSMLRKDQRWWDVPPRPSRFTIVVLERIAPRAPSGSDVLAARRLTATLRDRITNGFGHADVR